MAGGTLSDTGSAPFVGRDRELSAARECLEGLRTGRGRLVLVSGEPGIGKSRLAEKVSSLAEDQAVPTHWGRAVEVGGAPAFFPWTQILRSVLRDRGNTKAHPWEALGRLLPELRAEGAASPAPADPQLARFELFEGVSTLLQSVSAERPQLIILDDAHALDQSSLLLLCHVARLLRSMPVLILATCRDREIRMSQELSVLFGKLATEALPIPLGRLAPSEVRELVERIGDPAAPSDVVEAIHSVTEGLPLFVDATLRLLVARGELSRASKSAHIPLPAGVQGAIREAVSRLDPASAELLSIASVIGREFDHEVLTNAADDTADGVERALAAAKDAGLVTQLSADTSRFAHVLIRDELYKGLGAKRRAELHGRVCDALERAESMGKSMTLEALAHHALAAVAAFGPRRAVETVIQAADHAIEILAFEDAASMLERALTLADALDERPRFDLLLRLGQVYQRIARREDGKRYCFEAAQIARKLGETTMLAEAALGYGLEFAPALIDNRLVELLNESLEKLPPEDGALRARCMSRLAAALQPATDPNQPVALAHEAIEMARRVGDTDALRTVMYSALSALTEYDDPHRRCALNLEMLHLAELAKDRAQRLRTHARLVFDYLEAGRMDEGLLHTNEYARLAEEFSHPKYKWPVFLYRSMFATYQGRLDEARAQIRAAEELLAGAGLKEDAYWIAMHRGVFLISIDDMDEFAARLPELSALSERIANDASYAPVLRAFHAARTGAIDEARSFLAKAPPGFAYDHELFGGSLLAEVALALKDVERARVLLGGLKGFKNRIHALGMPVVVVLMPHERYRALLLWCLGEVAEANQELKRALSIARKLGLEIHLPRMLFDHAKLLTEHSAELPAEDVATVSALLKEAEERAKALHMTRLTEQIRRLAGTDLPPPSPAPKASPTLPRLRLEGEFWSIQTASGVARYKNSRGFQFLATLLDHPNQELHVLALSGEPDQVKEGDAGELLDDKAIAAYKTRALELKEELQEAESFNDVGRAERAREELDAIATELSRGLGIGGKKRKAGSKVERARINVQRRIKDAITRIEADDAELGRYLSRTVRTGTFCSFEP